MDKRIVWESPVIPWELCTPQRQEMLRKAWNAGALEYKYHPDQKIVVAETIKSWGKTQSSMERIAAWDISRQYGKDFAMATLGIASCYKRRKPTRIVYICSTKESLKELIVPTIVSVFQDCPPELLPVEIKKGTFERTADALTWPWGARIVLAGGELHPDRLRGPATYGFLFTECAFVPGLMDLMDGVILPQLLTIQDGWVVMASTPPVTPAHPWTIKYIPECKERGMYWKRNIYDNPRLSDVQIAAAIKSLGGMDSTRVRRELFCEHIIETSAVVIPEFSDENIVPNDYPEPAFYDAYTSLDPGMVHASGILGAFYDFANDRLVIDWDYAKAGQNSRALSRVIRAREWQMWGIVPQRPKSMTDDAWAVEKKLIEAEFYPGTPVRQSHVMSQRNGRLQPGPFSRYSDTEIRLICDLSTEHGLVFNPAQKDDLEAAINSLRLRIQERRIVFKERCVQAINHTRNALWNKQRTKFAEAPGGGHYDVLAALIYLNRELPWGRNPNPPNYFDGRTHHVPKKGRKLDPTHNAITAAFSTGRRRR